MLPNIIRYNITVLESSLSGQSEGVRDEIFKDILARFNADYVCLRPRSAFL